MIFKSTLLSVVAMSFLALSCSTFAESTPGTSGNSASALTAGAKVYAPNPTALKDFLDHPTFCNVFTGVKYDSDTLSYEASKVYSQAVVELLPNEADTANIREILANVRTACLAKLSAVSN